MLDVPEYDSERAGLIQGKILLVNRGGCLFVVKVCELVPDMGGGGN